MNLKLVATIGAIILILALSVGVGVKMMQKSEGYKAESQTFYTFEPHIMFGCSRYDAFRRIEAKPMEVKVVKPIAGNINSNPIK
jgi:hypothetical protein